MNNKRIYVVINGRVPGIYTDWVECREQIDGFPGAIYKGFNSGPEALAFIRACDKTLKEKTEAEKNPEIEPHQLTPETHKPKEGECLIAYVDGSYLNNQTGYGYVLIDSNGVIEEHYGPCGSYGMRQVCGEMTAAMRVASLARERNASKLTIYYDYDGIKNWVTGDWSARNRETSLYARKMRELRKNIPIVFEKVTAHSGNKYNELADKLAKRGTTGEVL